jgi:DNA-binding response OmpR family regulator
LVVDTAGNGHEAEAALSRTLYDLVISDWEMPHLKGIDLVGRMRAQPEWQSIPFIMVTAKSKKDEVLAAIRQGVTDYLVKPVTVEAFIGKVRSHLPGLVEKRSEEENS